MRSLACVVLLTSGALLFAPLSPARAEEDDLRLMRETASFTDVPDAMDESDPFDVNVHVGFTRSSMGGTIQRERPDTAGVGTLRQLNIAEWKQVVNRLELGLDIGLYHDLALFAALPIVLSDDRELDGLLHGRDGITSPPATPLWGDGTSASFRSPTRSGLDALTVGAMWSPINQMRSPRSPTITFLLSGRFGLGNVLRPCSRDAAVGCGNGTPGSNTSKPGVSRGTSQLGFETRFSYRHRYVEPYSGFGFFMEFLGQGEKQFLPVGDLTGFQNSRPPIVGEFVAGASIVPWEHRERFQRFAIDVRFTGRYVSEGLDYSPLFDALGTSRSAGLTSPNCEARDPTGADPCDPAAMSAYRNVYFNGMTNTSAHGVIGGRIGFELRAARYVRFGLATTLLYHTPYVLTNADPCNADVTVSDPPRRQGCFVGTINPAHRPEIDGVGNRFRIDGIIQYDLMATAVALF